MNLNVCNLPTQRDVAESTKCTVGKKERLGAHLPGGHPECRYGEGCCWPLGGKDEKHPYENRMGAEKLAIVLCDWGLGKERGLTFIDCESILLRSDGG